jgi:hypothetical protein
MMGMLDIGGMLLSSSSSRVCIVEMGTTSMLDIEGMLRRCRSRAGTSTTGIPSIGDIPRSRRSKANTGGMSHGTRGKGMIIGGIPVCDDVTAYDNFNFYVYIHSTFEHVSIGSVAKL